MVVVADVAVLGARAEVCVAAVAGGAVAGLGSAVLAACGGDVSRTGALVAEELVSEGVSSRGAAEEMGNKVEVAERTEVTTSIAGMAETRTCVELPPCKMGAVVKLSTRGSPSPACIISHEFSEQSAKGGFISEVWEVCQSSRNDLIMEIKHGLPPKRH